jgi:hypothetical protein
MKWSAWVLVASALVPARALADTCTSQLDCKGGTICTAGVCVAPECSRDLDCGAGRWCSNAGRCESGTPKAPVVPAAAPSASAPPMPPAPLPPASAPVPLPFVPPRERSWPAFFSAATIGFGGANDGYLQGRENQSFSGFLVSLMGCGGVAVSDSFAVGLAVTFLPMFEDGSFAPFGSVAALAAVRPASWIQLEASFGLTGGGVVAFGGVGPGWSIGLAIPIFRRARHSFDIGARLPMAYLIEPRTSSNTSFYIAPTLNAGYTLW